MGFIKYCLLSFLLVSVVHSLGDGFEDMPANDLNHDGVVNAQERADAFWSPSTEFTYALPTTTKQPEPVTKKSVIQQTQSDLVEDAINPDEEPIVVPQSTDSPINNTANSTTLSDESSPLVTSVSTTPLTVESTTAPAETTTTSMTTTTLVSTTIPVTSTETTVPTNTATSTEVPKVTTVRDWIVTTTPPSLHESLVTNETGSNSNSTVASNVNQTVPTTSVASIRQWLANKSKVEDMKDRQIVLRASTEPATEMTSTSTTEIPVTTPTTGEDSTTDDSAQTGDSDLPNSSTSVTLSAFTLMLLILSLFQI